LDKQRELFCKILVVGIIALFLLLGVQPAIAKTKEKINHPPSTPTIDGYYRDESGEYCFLFNTTDPDGDLVFYYIDWGDGNFVYWIGPFSTPTEFCHDYPPLSAIYEIQVKVKDIHGAESGWANIYILILRTRTTTRTMISNDDCDICPSIKRLRNLTDKYENKMVFNLLDDHLEKFKLNNPPWIFGSLCVILYLICYQYMARLMFLGITYVSLIYFIEPYTKLDEFVHVLCDLRWSQFWNFFLLANRLNCNWAWNPFEQ
jgi:hypothetical protein